MDAYCNFLSSWPVLTVLVVIYFCVACEGFSGGFQGVD